MTEVRFEDSSNDKGYFTIMPRLVLAMSPTPYHFAFYEAVKEITGELGECYLGTEKIAKLAKMSKGQASSCRQYWIQMGFMTGEIVKAPGHRQAVYHLRLKDIWPHNMAWSIEHLSIDSRLEHATSLSVQGVNRSGGELDRSGGEPKKNKKKTKRRPYANATGAAVETLGEFSEPRKIRKF